MDSDVARALRNLSVVSMLKQNDKILTGSDTFALHPPTVMRSTYRRWYGEGREANFHRLSEVISIACTHISNMSTTAELRSYSSVSEHVLLVQESNMRRRLVESLKSAKRGILNLADTYVDDTSYQVRLRLLVQHIDDFVSSFETVSECMARAIA